MALDLFTPDGFFNPSTTGFTIINSYSTKGPSFNTRSVPPEIIFAPAPSPPATWVTLTSTTPRLTRSGYLRKTRSPYRPLTSTGPQPSGFLSSIRRVFVLDSPCHSLDALVSWT